MLKSVIFDMDGVLVNSEPVHYRAYLMTLEQWGKTFSYDEYKTYIGTTNSVIIRGLIDKFDLPVTEVAFNERMNSYKMGLYEKEGYPGVDGVKELLQSLKSAGFLLAVASSSPYRNIVLAVEARGIRAYFDQLVSGESVPNPKPAPDVFLAAAKVLGSVPEDCLVIEDSCNGVRAAGNGGLACIGFENPDSGSQDLSLAVKRTKSFREVDAAYVKQAYELWEKTKKEGFRDRSLQK